MKHHGNIILKETMLVIVISKYSRVQFTELPKLCWLCFFLKKYKYYESSIFLYTAFNE